MNGKWTIPYTAIVFALLGAVVAAIKIFVEPVGPTEAFWQVVGTAVAFGACGVIWLVSRRGIPRDR